MTGPRRPSHLRLVPADGEPSAPAPITSRPVCAADLMGVELTALLEAAERQLVGLAASDYARGPEAFLLATELSDLTRRASLLTSVVRPRPTRTP